MNARDRFKAFFFDLDGTLLDSEVIYVDAVRAALQEKGYDISPEESLALVYGRGWQDIYQDIRQQFPGAYDDPTLMASRIRQIFDRMRKIRDIRIPGSVELLERLAPIRPTAIVSGAPRADIETGIKALGIEPLLRFYLGAEDYAPGKPAPVCYQIAAERLEVRSKECLVFEDSWAGVEAARAAGMRCVALKRPEAPEQDVSRADLVVKDLGDFDLSSLA